MTITPSGYRIPNLRELLIMQTRLPDDAWKSYPGAGLTDNGGGKAMYLSFTSFSRRSTETGGDGTLPNKNGGFRFNAIRISILSERLEQEISTTATSAYTYIYYNRGVHIYNKTLKEAVP